MTRIHPKGAPEVVIVGAGIAGLALALALARRGGRVTVLEQAGAIREFGAGLQITPNGWAVLAALGLAQDAILNTTPARCVELREGADGRLVSRLDLSRLQPDRGWHFVHRGDLVTALADAARAAGVTLLTGRRVEAAQIGDGWPRLRLSDGEIVEAEIAIGADGVHSRLRAALNGSTPARFTRRVAWRALVPGVAGAPPVAEVHMGPRRHLVSYPLHGGTLRNIVAVEERPRWVAEDWSFRDDPMELRLAFRGFGARVRGWLDQIDEVWLWGLFRHPVARHWQRAGAGGGALAILGDAAHPTLPFLAQGANLALEDAWVLAACLMQTDDRAAGLMRYQAARADRATRVVAAAGRAGGLYHLPAPLRGGFHMGLRILGRVAPGYALSRHHWIHGHDVTARS